MNGALTRAVFTFVCQEQSHNLPCYYCIAQLSANQGRAHPHSPHPTQNPGLGRARARPRGPKPGANGMVWGGGTPLNRKIGVPTLPFIA